MHLCIGNNQLNRFRRVNMKKFLHTIIVSTMFLFSAQAQTGEIQGKVTDEKGEPVPFAMVVVIRDQMGKELTSKGTKADVNGFYTLKGVAPGTYNLMAKSLGKPNAIEIGVQVFSGRPVTLNFQMEQKSTTKKEVVIKGTGVAKPVKIIDVFQPKETVIGEKEIKESSVRDVGSIAAGAGGIVQSDVGAELNVGGGRSEGLVYFVDGVKMTGSAGVPPNQIQQMEVITSGVPAKYGDANAGVISITTKGPSDKLRGSVEGLTSKFLDPYGYKLGNFSLTGPILRRRATYDSTNPAAPQKIKGEPILGFSIGAEYQQEDDRVPTANGNWKLKDEKYQEIINNPYRLTASGDQLIQASEFVGLNDLEKTDAHQNTDGSAYRFNGKLDWKVVKNSTNITLGFRGEQSTYKDFTRRYSIFNFENNPIQKDNSFNGFIRLYQPLFNDEKQVNKIFRNTNIQLQFDATRSGRDIQTPVAKNGNPWYIGYIGKFVEDREWQYERRTEDDGTKVYYTPNDFLIFKDFYTANTFRASGLDLVQEYALVNPLAFRFTDSFISKYAQWISPLASVTALENAGGVANGSRSSLNIHDLFMPMARVFNQIRKEENDQFRISGSINFDIVRKKSKDLNKHTIEAGFELEQRINSRYNISPLTLWNTGQTLLNQHLTSDNTKNFNPLLIMRGGSVRMRMQDYIKQDTISFSAFDTLLYDKEISNGGMTNFSKNLRNELFGGDSLARVNIHELDPDKMKLEWFSPDELIEANIIGAEQITGSDLRGYDFYGNKLPTSVTFNDFFTAKDSKGNYLRHVSAYMPRYGAAYIQDRFQLKDLALNVGFRVDYFDPNTYSLRDPYVPQGARTIAEVTKLNGSDVSHPSNLPSNAVVYVDDLNNPTRVTGYRVGEVWYSKEGKEQYGPKTIELEAGRVIPYLQGDTEEERKERGDMSFPKFNPDLMFVKSSSKFAFSPRVNFSFTIDTFSLLFAHYDVLNQRPEQFVSMVSSLNYYNLIGNSRASSIGNPDLGFSSTTDLEVGFKQRLSARSSLTINFQYREYNNLVGVTSRVGAYPGTYTTFSNNDFATVKSIGFAYELRRTNNLRLRANYTMSFADGSSSSRTAQLNLINAGLGNIKVISPLDFDSRHNIKFNPNYRFDSRNYIGPAKLKPILKDLGIDLAFNLRSGSPFTYQDAATPTATMNGTSRSSNVGDVNSASMPWFVNANLKIDKDFNFKFGKVDSSRGGDNRREYGINLYLQITNLFNSMNVLKVYRYSGSASTDGYLGSQLGIADIAQKETRAKGYGEAFRELYKIALEIPEDRNSMYSRPRVIQVGATLSF